MAAPSPSIATVVGRALDALLAGLAGLVVLAIVLGRIVPVAGHETLVVAGRSMEPAIPMGALVILDPDAQAGVGDVVSIRTGSGTVVTHRVVDVVALDGVTHYRTKGDANGAPDPALVPAGRVIGRVAVAVPLAGFLVGILSVPSGLVLVACLAGLLVAARLLVEDLADERLAPARALGPARALSR